MKSKLETLADKVDPMRDLLSAKEENGEIFITLVPTCNWETVKEAVCETAKQLNLPVDKINFSYFKKEELGATLYE